MNNACQLSSKELEKLINTKDDDLLKEFPQCTRRELRHLKERTLKKPRILITDIETSQMLVKVWQLRGNEYIEPSRIVEDWFVICWAGKWLGEKEVMSDVVTPREARKRNDRRVVISLFKLLDEADLVIAHNGDKFDIAKLKTRFLKHNLKLPSPYLSIDTLKVARKEFRLTSNKLDYICRYLGIPAKIETGGITLWDESEQGNEEALNKMDKYCKNDVKILEDVYLELRPYIRNHPNLALYMESEEEVCPNCGSTKLTKGYVMSTTNNQYECAKCECGAYVRFTKSILDKDKRNLLLK